MKHAFRFTLTAKDAKSRARAGIIHTPHGAIETPAFVPVGTQATVKSLTPEELKALDVHLFFVNTYHMYVRPGIEVICKSGGLHRFMAWDRPIITDSGGFQVFSLGRQKFRSKNDRDQQGGELVKITEEGVAFRSHWDGGHHMLTPELSMELQWQLGSDIHIAFDDCTPYPVSQKAAGISMERTHRWAVRSVAAHENNAKKRKKSDYLRQALYGSVQGSVFRELREASARFITGLNTDGIAIGGMAVGESKREMRSVLSWTMPLLPEEKPRHLLGVGEIDDIFMAVSMGIDTFDCVSPTRLARMGQLLVPDKATGYVFDVNRGNVSLDLGPVETGCACYTCETFTRAYLHHLFKVRELLGYRLATIHNIHFVNRLTAQIRQSIGEGRFLELAKRWL